MGEKGMLKCSTSSLLRKLCTAKKSTSQYSLCKHQLVKQELQLVTARIPSALLRQRITVMLISRTRSLNTWGNARTDTHMILFYLRQSLIHSRYFLGKFLGKFKYEFPSPKNY